MESKAERPDNKRSNWIENHSSCSAQLFGNAYAGEIEEGDTDDGAWVRIFF